MIKVKVDYYGAPTPVNQLAAVSVTEARTLTIQPWDASVLRQIEKAIQTSDIGINPQNDGKIIRLIFPPLTEDRRKEIVKDVQKIAEETKIQIRNVRRELIDKLKAMKKDGELTEDDLKQGEKKAQDLTDKYIKEVESVSAVKQKEILEMYMAFFSKKKDEQIEVTDLNLPSHIGIIMDGNGRWAKKRGLPRKAGHRQGAKTFRTITRYCSDIGIKYLTVYAFSTENWKRPQEEVDALMSLFKSYLNEALEDFKDDSIVVKFIGDKSGFNDELRELMIENEESSKDRDGMVLNIAMNYGSRDEIVRAVRNISEDVRNGKISSDDITENLFSNYLYTAGQPDPDLIIRPSGEYRISNFLLWQSAYTEFVIMNKLWPDFQKSDLDEALKIYSSRNRRYGGV